MIALRTLLFCLAGLALGGPLKAQNIYHNIFDHENDRGLAAVVFTDGSVMTGGTTDPGGTGGPLLWLQYLDPQGNLIWSRRLDASPGVRSVVMEKNGDNQALVAFTAWSGPTDPTPSWLMVDIAGNIGWSRRGTAGLEVRALTPLSDGYLLSGRHLTAIEDSDAAAWKISGDDGAVVWSTVFGAGGEEWLNGCWADDQGLIFCTGSASMGTDPGQADGMLAGLSATTGAVQFTRLYGTSSPEELIRVAPLSDDRLLLAGISEGFGDNIARVWLVATNLGGDVVWTKTLRIANTPIGTTDLAALSTTQFVIAANDPDRPIGNPALLMQITVDGNLAWAEQINTGGVGPAGERTTLEQVRLAPDGGYIVAGTASFSGESSLHAAHLDPVGRRPPCAASPVQPIQDIVTITTPILSTSVSGPPVSGTPVTLTPTNVFPETQQTALLADPPDIDVSFSISDTSMLCPGLCVIVTFGPQTPGVEYSFDEDEATIDPTQLGRLCFPEVGTYNLKRTGLLGCFSADTTIEVQVGPAADELNRINAFTPNGDSFNDTFRPYLGCPPVRYHLTIYNRWGDLVFESREYDLRWSGADEEGEPFPSDVYAWRLEYSTGDDPETVNMISGDVSLLR
jgi:gliding motility-associated-like protein